MPEKYGRTNSVYDSYSKKKDKNLFHKKISLSGRQLTVGIIIGVFLTIVTIVLQCVAFFTPHWKEISPNTHSLYVDGIDALIRNEVLIYFNSVHRFTRHSYGLFQRCEYLLNDSSKLVDEQQQEILNIGFNQKQKICTKNFFPSYEDEQFNECHSLQYYRFCSRTGEKIFDIHNDYLRAKFDILSNPNKNLDSKSSCDCHYPKYVRACHVLEIFALIFLFLTALLFGIFPFLKNRNQCLKVKCFGVLSSILAILFILINLLVVLNHLDYESIEYLIAIERHYRASQIYKLSQDTKIATDRFMSSINIKIGYSTIIAWIAFILSIVDGILLMLTCKITRDEDDIELRFTAMPMDSSPQNSVKENEEHQGSTTPLASAQKTTDFQSPPLPPKNTTKNFDEKGKTHLYFPPSCLKHSNSRRIHFDETV
jgi:hypothetical protein